MNDQSIMPFGVHKGKRMEDVPDSYLLWYWNLNVDKFRTGVGLNTVSKRLMEYIEDNLDSIQK